MSSFKLAQPVVEVVQEVAGDYVATTVQTDNRDAIAWDLQRGKRGYPVSTEAPVLWLTFLAYNALRRTGVQVGKFDEFLERAVSVRPVRDDGTPIEPGEEDAYAVGPTNPAPEPA